jgi:hypothetical protein
MVPVLVFKESPPYKPTKTHNGDNGDYITRPVKGSGGKPEPVYVADFGFTRRTFAGLERQIGITFRAFFGHKTVTAGAAAIIISGHIPSPFINF